jgi:hypothetical protein
MVEDREAFGLVRSSTAGETLNTIPILDLAMLAVGRVGAAGMHVQGYQP